MPPPTASGDNGSAFAFAFGLFRRNSDTAPCRSDLRRGAFRTRVVRRGDGIDAVRRPRGGSPACSRPVAELALHECRAHAPRRPLASDTRPSSLPVRSKPLSVPWPPGPAPETYKSTAAAAAATRLSSITIVNDHARARAHEPDARGPFPYGKNNTLAAADCSSGYRRHPDGGVTGNL